MWRWHECSIVTAGYLQAAVTLYDISECGTFVAMNLSTWEALFSRILYKTNFSLALFERWEKRLI